MDKLVDTRCGSCRTMIQQRPAEAKSLLDLAKSSDTGQAKSIVR
jgi:hypothetical protein